MRTRYFLAMLLSGLASTVWAQPPVDLSSLQASSAYQVALDYLDQDSDRFVRELIQLTEIPAPPFAEGNRAAAYLEMLRATGLDDAVQDKVGNVMALRPGVGGGPLLAVHIMNCGSRFKEAI